jgi:NAD(P)-dependent dehydrogenase (short-subunit alcohol dehydrogenase family)
MDAAEDKVKELITLGVTRALTSTGVPRPVAGMAARAAVDALTKLLAYKQWDAVRRGVRLLAVCVCPAVENHPEVVNYCLRPLASENLSDAIQQELAQISRNTPAVAS